MVNSSLKFLDISGKDIMVSEFEGLIFKNQVQFKGTETTRLNRLLYSLWDTLITRGREGFSRYETPRDYSRDEAIFLVRRLKEMGTPDAQVENDSHYHWYRIIITW